MLNRKLYILMMLLAAVIFETACSQLKDSTTNASDAHSVQINSNYHGGTVTTRYASEGCNYLIHIAVKRGTKLKEPILINPVNLPDKYKKEGAEITFTYTPSKAPQTEHCRMGIWAHIEIKEM